MGIEHPLEPSDALLALDSAADAQLRLGTKTSCEGRSGHDVEGEDSDEGDR
jgi:hypothetical protein